VAAAFSFGFKGGLTAGILALPVNLLLFTLIGHPEYSPASKIIAQAAGIAVGSVLGYLGNYYHALEMEVERRREVEKELVKTLEEKEILLHEIHHRIKNNLNIINSLVQLQLNRSNNAEFIEEGEKLMNRLHSISLVHNQLYDQCEPACTYLVDYLPALVDNVVHGLDEGRIRILYQMDAPGQTIDADQAAPLGLIINEVITNAIKHGLSQVESPEVLVALKEEGSLVVIEISDNAPPFVPGNREYQGLGIKLISTLSRQLGGSYEYLSRGGTLFRLTFPG
jgi:two-component sensor histidine kinase